VTHRGSSACVRTGAEAFTANSATQRHSPSIDWGAAAYLICRQNTSQINRADQERESDGIAKAVKDSGLRYAVHLSKLRRAAPEGTGPIAGLHSSDKT